MSRRGILSLRFFNRCQPPLRVAGACRINSTIMEEATEGQGVPQDRPDRHSARGWQVLWFLVHLAAVYTIVKFVTPWLAGWTHGTLLPQLQHPTSSGRFEFFFSHILAFSFIPAFLSGLVNARFKHKAAQFVWLVPAAILAYKFATSPAPSVFQSQFSAAFHQYFGGEFVIPEFHDFHDLFSTGSNADVWRGVAQHQFTAPFYAGVAYSAAAWIGLRTELSRKVAERVKKWEQSRVEHQL